MTPRPPCQRGAFTLIEIIAVVILLGLLATLAAWSFSGPLRRAQFDQALEQVRYLNATSRALARDTGQLVTMTFDLDRGEVSRSQGRRGGAAVYRASLAPGARIDRVRTATDDRTSGTAEVAVSPLGLSPSYAVRLAGPNWRRWVFVSGLGGDARVIRDDSEIAAIFAAARDAARRDAH